MIEQKYPGTVDKISECIETYKQQRFGQIVCNYIAPDYRWSPCRQSQDVMHVLFHELDMDPFFEESEDTMKRLNTVDFSVAQFFLEKEDDVK